MDWRPVETEFWGDGGALLDINVLDTDLEDWQLVLNHLRHSYAPLDFQVDGNVSSLPASVHDVFALHESANTMLSFDVARIRMNCFFFAAHEIDFDLLAEDLHSQAHLEAVLSFISTLGRLTRKVVVLTPEGAADAPILHFDPASDAVVYT